MSFHGKRELLVQVAPRYSSARHRQRSVILDEFVAVTGYERKYAIRLLLGPIRPPAPIRRPRVAHYGPAVQEALSVVWSAANGICAKRLVPFLPELIPTLERHGHLVVTDEVREQLLTLSAATVDRLLRPLRQPHGLSTTKPGRLLKKQIPIRTFTEWADVKPGFLEGDLVAHCGGRTDGSFLYTFTLTDIATTWTECLALLHRTQHGVVHALERARGLFPFPILGIDTDNGSEFINTDGTQAHISRWSRLRSLATRHWVAVGRLVERNAQPDLYLPTLDAHLLNHKTQQALALLECEFV
jgi:hypothetical protein